MQPRPRRIAFLIPLFLTPWVAYGSGQIATPGCTGQVQSVLKRWAPGGRWRRELGSLDDQSVFRAPSPQIGTWIELHRSLTGEVKVLRISARDASEYSWNPLNCEPRYRFQKLPYDDKALREAFSDDYLRQQVHRHRAGLIYAWSPAMPLSLRAYRAIQKAARRLHLVMIPVLDVQASPSEAAKVARLNELEPDALRRMESVELFMRGMSVHFPSVLVFRNGKIQGETIPGAHTEDVYLTMIRRELARR